MPLCTCFSQGSRRSLAGAGGPQPLMVGAGSGSGSGGGGGSASQSTDLVSQQLGGSSGVSIGSLVR